MRQLATSADHPARTADANEKRRATRKAQREAELAWEREHPKQPDDECYRREVFPELASRSAGEIARITGLSVGYCARVQRGDRDLHPRWWAAVLSLKPTAVTLRPRDKSNLGITGHANREICG
jgi:hypothetical protein